MRVITVVAGAATALALYAGAASAQDRPDFSGTWTLDQEKTTAANPAGQGGGQGGGRGGRGGGMGMMGGTGPITLKLDGTTFVRESQGPQGNAMTVTYRLDGSAQNVAMGQGQATAKATWDGGTIVVETTRQTQMGAFTTKTVYAMEGEYLVVSNTTQTPNGEITRKQYYRKS